MAASLGCVALWCQAAQKVFTEIIKTVARFQPITVGVNTEDFPAVCEIFDGVENVRVIHMEYNDSWIRDPRPGVS